jgi:hypothetical protein
MTYFRVSDCFWSSPKSITLSDSAVALWTRAGSYCGQHLTDGFVSAQILPILQGNESTANELVASGLWVTVDGGYLFHDWSDYNRDSESVKREREANRERQRAWVARKRASESVSDDVISRVNNDVTNGVSDGVTNDSDGVGKERNGKERKGINTKKNCDDSFNEFWSVYPRRVGKQAAQKAFLKALTFADASVIIDGARRYANDPNRSDEFTAHPTTWINQGRWEDDPLPARRDDSKQGQRRANFEAFIGQGQISAG